MRAARVYRAKRTACHQGKTHASVGEARRCNDLHMLQLGGAVSDLVVQPTWALEVNGVKVGRYTADFQYLDVPRNERVVEDFKGGPVSRDVPLRLKLMKALYGIDVWINRGGRR